MARIDVNACAKMVTDVAARCAPPSAAAPAHEGPNFDSLATSIAFGSAAIMAVTLIVVALGIFVAVRWGQSVVREAKDEASKAAEKHVDEFLRGWRDSTAPALVRTHVELILAQSPATPAADAATDRMGEQA